MKLPIFLFLSSYLLINSSGVQFHRKISQGGVSFLSVQNYTTELQKIKKKEEVELSINILIIADFSLYNGFLDVAKGDTVSAQHYVEEYLHAIFDQMTVIYDHIEIMKHPLKLNLVGTFITFREEDCPMLSEFDDIDFSSNSTSNHTFASLEEFNSTDLSLSMPALDAVKKLSFWIKQNKGCLPQHDHAILLTKFDLLSTRGDSSTQGMANVGEICKIGDSSSIVEDVGAAATALIAAHELGHSLGSFHDGYFNSSFECDSRDNFLMATTVSGSSNSVLFDNSRMMSPCSIQSIEKKLREPSAKCVWKKKNVERKEAQPLRVTLDKKPGERIPLHQQCQIAFGPHYGSCPSAEYYHNPPFCQRVWCKNRMEKRNYPCETRTYLPALDGTECGRNKWCIEGKCVLNLKKLADCRDLNAKTCAKYSKSKLRHYCNSRDFQDICCMSCAKLKDPPSFVPVV